MKKPIYKNEQGLILSKLREAMDCLDLKKCDFGQFPFPNEDNPFPTRQEQVDGFIKYEIQFWVEWTRAILQDAIQHFEIREENEKK